MATKYNIRVPLGVVRDYNVAQGYTHPSDSTHQIIRDINLRYVTVENSSPYTPVGIAIADSWEIHPIPPINFSLAPGEIRHIGINPFGENMQYIHILDLKTKRHIGQPSEFRTNSNQFVLREGINKWFVDYFRRPSYTASH